MSLNLIKEFLNQKNGVEDDFLSKNPTHFSRGSVKELFKELKKRFV